MDPFIGEIRAFAFDWAPSGWALCAGQLMSISQNTALFSLLGVQYGGDGTTTFALPDLRGRVGIGAGQGPGLSPRVQGGSGGQERVQLSPDQLPAHTHSVAAASASTSKSPADAVPGFTSGGSSYGTTADVAMNPQMVSAGGGNQPHDNMPPYLVLTWCIAVEGVYPSRP